MLPDILHNHRKPLTHSGTEADFLSGVTRDDVEEASRVLSKEAVRPPLLSCTCAEPSGDRSIWVKPENLQPRGSFKIRCSLNAISNLEPARLSKGIYTASTGNFALGLTHAARAREVDVRVYVTETAAKSKIAALRELGAEVIETSFDKWWAILCGETPDGENGTFVHPCSGRDVIVGNATIGQEIFEDLPNVDAILVPFGGGGLMTGIALARTLWGSPAKVYACETEAATPLYSSFLAGAPVEVPVNPSPMVTGIGVSTVLQANWPYLSAMVDGVVVSSLDATADAIRRLAKNNHIVVEGAGAAALAAADHPFFSGKCVAAVLTGGGIDMHVFAAVMTGDRSGYDAPSRLRNYE
ncbi:pyridoxal-phosphate dependent enzyme [Paraburkholderia elongata]|uniref:Pyridoxal-phosphate dependent enzyme n=1 Tax=Paraburkholderia elongata TaxID=2675747 RepID=A0A972NXT7_9BURK|nr:pyridoxal-phosphate dependent enzyme [Paraburkholderia elongata]NPT60458.1 pyridoxal-phosphate dependent enzyme [Paraburkholderia elongata]